MTSSKDKRPAAPLEDVTAPLLQDAEYAAYYLADAIACLDEDPEGLVAALVDIIKANRRDYNIPMLCLVFSFQFLSGSQLSGLIDCLEEELEPTSRSRLADFGVFGDLRRIAGLMAEGNQFRLTSIEDSPVRTPQGMAQATQSLQSHLNPEAYRQMEKIIAA